MEGPAIATDESATTAGIDLVTGEGANLEPKSVTANKYEISKKLPMCCCCWLLVILDTGGKNLDCFGINSKFGREGQI